MPTDGAGDDPIRDWFTRRRVVLAGIVWALIVLGRIDDLLSGELGRQTSWVHAAVFFGLVCWQLGSRADRDEPRSWLRLVVAWSAYLVVRLGLLVVEIVRDRFEPLGLVSIGLAASLLAQHVWRYRRTRRGVPWDSMSAFGRSGRSRG
ncbi:hypothetical protein [Nocardioides plantarum]|uniref:Uncharacterized protein n=1 Tax=Nocardioides plantarum TaxID=29299 RepID=A0ABV5KBQ6_9ACTN|nr:hypothetical protein [Nocardioides plantarum]